MKPEECSNLKDVRVEIDAIDKKIVELLGQRLNYVYAASRYKPTEESISAPERVVTMLEERKIWASQCNISEQFILSLFQTITSWYISEQVIFWRNKHGYTEDKQ